MEWLNTSCKVKTKKEGGFVDCSRKKESLRSILSFVFLYYLAPPPTPRNSIKMKSVWTMGWVVHTHQINKSLGHNAALIHSYIFCKYYLIHHHSRLHHNTKDLFHFFICCFLFYYIEKKSWNLYFFRIYERRKYKNNSVLIQQAILAFFLLSSICHQFGTKYCMIIAMNSLWKTSDNHHWSVVFFSPPTCLSSLVLSKPYHI